MPADFTLGDLHHVILIAMGWEDCHLHDFTIKKRRYALAGDDGFDDVADERENELRDVARAGSKFSYQYDFGDGWEHVILVEKAAAHGAAAGPVCVDGARACPPEDSGGPWGYDEKLRALSHPDEEETQELREWMGEFDPEVFDLESVNAALRQFVR